MLSWIEFPLAYDYITFPTIWKWIGYLPTLNAYPTSLNSIYEIFPTIESSPYECINIMAPYIFADEVSGSPLYTTFLESNPTSALISKSTPP